ncbi:MAG TPA: SIR2 family protein [Bryobacteraceae bacterium]
MLLAPTGWEVVQDLARKLARVEGNDSGQDPEDWYRKAYKVEPDYSALLDSLVKTPSERSQRLRTYFEPSEDERQRGLKVPTRAHRAVAELVKQEYIRVIITTHFDRLLETALADVGLQPSVISTTDAVKGALPLSHARCSVLKVNGDYLDTRIKNTKAELDAYDPALSQLLDLVFDEFGLLVCGWSGDWDVALRDAIERCSTRRFSMYWAYRGEPTPVALRLIQRRAAIQFRIDEADAFFTALKDKRCWLSPTWVRTIPYPRRSLRPKTKHYLVRPEDRILLHDLVAEETERCYEALDPQRFHTNTVNNFTVEVGKRFNAYESTVEVVCAILTAGNYWGQAEHRYLWTRVLQRLGDPPGGPGGLTRWIGFRRYPASLLMYAGSVAAIDNDRFDNLAQLLRAPIRGSLRGQTEIAANCLNVLHIMQDRLSDFIPGKERALAGYSDHLFEVLREPLRPFTPTEAEYEEAFHLFEYFMSLMLWQQGHRPVPIGRARWLRSELFSPDGPTDPSNPRIAAAAAALFANREADYDKAKREYDAWALSPTLVWGSKR